MLILIKNSGRLVQIRIFLVLLCVLCVSVVNLSCSSPPTDLRTLAPADTLVYLETNDLGKALSALTESRAFREAAKRTPDFSFLAGMQTAVAVTGFEPTESQVTLEKSLIGVEIQFIAIADTHAWNWQTLSFTEKTLGGFVNQKYGGEVILETSDKMGGKSFIWKAKDGRKVFAFVIGSRVFFSNNETSLEKSLAVLRGEADSFAKNGKRFEIIENTLANGYISPNGVSQISEIAGVSTAIEATDDDQGRSFIARVLPQILRGSVREVFWTANKTEAGIEDRYTISLTPENTAVVKETLVPAKLAPSNSAEFIAPEVFSATRYNLENPQIAWRSLLLVAGKNTDAASAKILIAFSGSLLAPYGVADAEAFLSAVDSEIWTAGFDAENEKSVVIVGVKDAEKLKKAIAGIDFSKPGEKSETAEIRKSEDNLTAAAFAENKLILGDAESVLKCLQAKASGKNFTNNAAWKNFAESGAVALTYGRDSTEKIIEFLGEKKAENAQLLTNYTTETRFNASGIERRTVSPFGLIGRILEQFED